VWRYRWGSDNRTNHIFRRSSVILAAAVLSALSGQVKGQSDIDYDVINRRRSSTHPNLYCTVRTSTTPSTPTDQSRFCHAVFFELRLGSNKTTTQKRLCFLTLGFAVTPQSGSHTCGGGLAGWVFVFVLGPRIKGGGDRISGPSGCEVGVKKKNKKKFFRHRTNPQEEKRGLCNRA
jgi:hypothetical protein